MPIHSNLPVTLIQRIIRNTATRKQLLIVVVWVFAILLVANSISPVQALSFRPLRDKRTTTTMTIVVGLNPALQKRFVLSQTKNPTLVKGSVHRAETVEEGIGGKGQDVAVSLSKLWPSNNNSSFPRPLCLAQFVSNDSNGDRVLSLLRNVLGDETENSKDRDTAAAAAAWETLTVRTKSPMRTCTSIVGVDATTELVEPSGFVQEQEWKSLLEKLENHATIESAAAAAGALVFMGSMPPGCPEEMYAKILSSLVGKSQQSMLLLIDSVVGLKPLIRTLEETKKRKSKSLGNCILKINASELCRLAGVVSTNLGEAEGTSQEDLQMAIARFLIEYKVGGSSLNYLAITDGKHPAHLVKIGVQNEKQQQTPTIIQRMYTLGINDLANAFESAKDNDCVLYPIGAGDTVAAGTISSLLYLQDYVEDDGSSSSVSLSTNSPLEDHCSKALLSFRNNIMERCSNNENDDANMLAAFCFGLACGSASCLERENSVFSTKTAIRLLEQMPLPEEIIKTKDNSES